ncbi:MAG: AmmeMemoRadiSam system protein B [Armatimonadota bacterium]
MNLDERIRPAAVAGQFYPGHPASLRAALEEAFLSPLGPGDIPAVGPGPRRLIGIVSPHAGYLYSAQGAAWGYAAAARDGQPSLVVILGVNHRGIGAPLALSPATGWQTPLGVAPVSVESGRRLRELAPVLEVDGRAHAHEHSLEVQVPFVQYLFGDVPIVPIAIGAASWSMVSALGVALAQLAREQDILFIASSDFSHYVAQQEAERLDRIALEAIAAVDAVKLLDAVRLHEITMCGVLPVAVLLTVAKEFGQAMANILHYHTSGDVTGDRWRVVGYGSVAVSRPSL